MKELLIYGIIIIFVCFTMTLCDKFLNFIKSKISKKKEVKEDGSFTE